MKFDTRKLKEESEQDYEKAWRESGNLIEEEGKLFSPERNGSSHPLFDLVQDSRKILIDLGFQEVVVPTLIEKDEIRKQYGPTAPVILDRIFFLAGLDRSDLGISQEDLEEIRKKVPDFDKTDELENIFRRYKEGEIPSDDIAEVIIEELKLDENQASHILSLFESFKKLEPVPSDMTLRSHTTAGWFPVLRDIKSRKSLPIQLFTIGPKYRREQKLDETHLYRSWTASLVIMAEEISIEDGKELTEKVLNGFGFDKVEFERKSATSKYYAPGTEFEIFVKHPHTDERIEVGDAGFYSPISLANYSIEHPVFNLGIGLERVLMIRTGERDIRSLVYPYKYEELEFSDEEISKMIKINEKPVTEVGQKLAKEIRKKSKELKEEPSPCEFDVFEGRIGNSKVSVRLYEPEENTKLIGPAAFNQIYVIDGNIVGVPPESWEDKEFLQKAREEGVPTGIDYMEAFANLAARKIEKTEEKGKDKLEVRVPIVESLSDINLELEKPARRYITNNNKKIDIRGPVFTTIVAEMDQDG